MATKKEQPADEVNEAGEIQVGEKYQGPTVQVATSAKVAENAAYTHPLTKQTIAREAVSVPDDVWTRRKLRSEELEAR